MRVLLGVLVALCVSGTAHAGQLAFVAGFPPGGPSSLIARHLADVFQAELGVTTIVENRPGAAGRVAADYVRQHGADGGTVLVMASTSTLKTEPGSGLVPIGRVSKFDFVFVQGKAFGGTNVREYFTAVRRDETLETYTTPGAGSIPHLVMIEIARRENLELRHVPYQGSTPALQAVLGGHVAAALFGISEAGPALESGLRPLFVTGGERSKRLPTVPTLMELGFDIDTSGWHALYAHKDVAADIVAAYNRAIRTAAEKLPEALIQLGFQGAATSPDEMDAIHRRDYERWMKVAVELGIKP